MSEQTIFTAALEQEPARRKAFLDEACAENPELRRRVEVLLNAHGQFNELLDGDGIVPTLDQPLSERPGTMIGPYKLLQQIGEGGMGTVYMAEQTHPVQRKVALKVIKPGMDSQQIIARFEAERQALAIMDHVNIARVLDAGATVQGRPYFVMELVHGVPMTKYCDDNRLTPRQRLELFVPVCQAIQHAHQKQEGFQGIRVRLHRADKLEVRISSNASGTFTDRQEPARQVSSQRPCGLESACRSG